MSVGFVGQRESATAALGTASFDGNALDALHFGDGEVTFYESGSVAATAKVKSFSFDISLNRDTDNAYSIGDSTYRRAPPAQRRDISGSIEFNQVVYASATNADEPTYDNLIATNGDSYQPTSNQALRLKLSDEAGTDSIEIDFFHVRFESPEASVSGRDTNTMTVNFIGLFDAVTNSKAMQVTMLGTQLSATQYDA